MESALLNLCLNAGQAITGPGLIRIRLTPATPDMVQIEVTDSGCGMSPDVLAHAVEPFFTTRGDGTGTGLGLAMVYGFIRQSGGDLDISSKVGEGTVVRLLLPAFSARENELGASLRILLVDDNASDAAHARRIFAKATITETSSASEAIELISISEPFDLVVTDLNILGHPAGWLVAEAALRHSPTTRVIVVSGHLPSETPLIDRFSSRAACLAKPLNPSSLVAFLKGGHPA
jgi:CheY-like chemotaxis protein